MSANPSSAGGFCLATVSLRSPQDLVWLSSRVRAAGEEFGLDERDQRNLSVATHDTARLLLDETVGEVWVGEGPSLQVVFRSRTAAPHRRAALRAHLSDAAVALGDLVHWFRIEEAAGELIVRLCTRFPMDAAERMHGGGPVAAGAGAGAETDDVPVAELPRRHEALRHAFRELQAELQETNRGVVALHAELEAQADRLRQAEDRMRLLLDSVQDYAIVMLTPEGEVASWNAGAERLFGYVPDGIIGRHFGCFSDPAACDPEAAAGQLRIAEAQGRFECECQQVRRGGAVFAAHVVISAVRRGRELRGFSLVVRDVTERKRLEDDLRRRAEDLAAANRAKEEFLATLSHELRTPLNAMLGWTRLLRLGDLDPRSMARALEVIERNAHVQEQLIADILDVSRIVTGKLRVELQPIDLGPVVDAALDAVRPAAEAKDIRLSSARDFQGTVLGDPDRLQQVVWNLLVNAIKFTPAGGRISVTVARAGPSAAITVSDTGDGIPAPLLPVIFDRFTQGDASATRPHGGLGLGLSIVRHIVELHGGRVQADSAGEGQGATFTVHLPVRAVQHAEIEPREDSRQPLRGVKVLVVDDDADARDVVSRALAQCGARTTAVGSAREALRMLPDLRPDVLISDLGMPDEDGYALIERVRALATGGVGDVPAVALTAYSEPEDRRRALSAGFQEFVSKPVEVAELAAVVRTLANERRH